VVGFKKQTLKKGTGSLVTLPVNIKNLHILGVDDNATNRMIMTRMVEGFGCRIETAASGPKALEMVQTAYGNGDPYQVILLDMQMPDMDGEQTARAVKADPNGKDIHIIILTSMGQRGDAARLEAIGCSGYLLKPVKQTLLHEALVTVLGQKQSGDAGRLVTRHIIAEQKRQGMRILLAEDNPINQRVALAMLKRLGCWTDVVANGREAVEALQNVPYDLVLMDCQMPVMDGFEATRAVRQREAAAGSPSIPIVAMTASAMQADRERCQQAGMSDFIAKPVQPGELAEMLARWLAISRSDPGEGEAG